MDKPVDASMELATTPPAAEMHYRDDTVTRVLVRVERADGRIREYEAREPQDFDMSDPESFASMSVMPTRLSIGAGGGFVSVPPGDAVAAAVVHREPALQPAHPH